MFVKGKYEFLLKRYIALPRQDDFAIVFAIVAEKLYESGSLVKM